MATPNPFGTAVCVAERQQKMKQFSLEQCYDALELSGLQETTRKQLEKRIRKLQESEKPESAESISGDVQRQLMDKFVHAVTKMERANGVGDVKAFIPHAEEAIRLLQKLNQLKHGGPDPDTDDPKLIATISQKGNQLTAKFEFVPDAGADERSARVWAFGRISDALTSSPSAKVEE